MTTEPMTSRHLNARGCRLALPVSGTFELTPRCNFNCRICYVHLNKDIESIMQRELSTEEWLSIAEQAKEMGLMFLLLTGGEPFLRADFPYLYERLVKMGFIISINTNASLYNDRLSELFAKYPPCRINVTLYGASEETYKRLCGNASFEKVVNNLKRMKQEKLPVRLNVSLTPYNVCDMEGIDAISQELGIHAKATSYMYPPVRVSGCIGENSARFTAEEAGRAIVKWYGLRESNEDYANKAEALNEKLRNDRECAECFSNEGSEIKCRAGRSSFWITWDGKMTPCGTMSVEGSDVRVLGFKAAWEQVNSMAREVRLPVECESCELRSSCSVCASICKGETGHFDKKPEYLCTMTRARIQEIFRIAGIDGGQHED